MTGQVLRLIFFTILLQHNHASASLWLASPLEAWGRRQAWGRCLGTTLTTDTSYVDTSCVASFPGLHACGYLQSVSQSPFVFTLWTPSM